MREGGGQRSRIDSYWGPCVVWIGGYGPQGWGVWDGSDSDSEDHDRVVPRGRLLENYQRLALHTERHLNGKRGG
jgi:hypothetical protein